MRESSVWRRGCREGGGKREGLALSARAHDTAPAAGAGAALTLHSMTSSGMPSWMRYMSASERSVRAASVVANDLGVGSLPPLVPGLFRLAVPFLAGASPLASPLPSPAAAGETGCSGGLSLASGGAGSASVFFDMARACHLFAARAAAPRPESAQAQAAVLFVGRTSTAPVFRCHTGAKGLRGAERGRRPGAMPLCNGVRPLYEDMPSRDGGGNVELFTSNTTAPILSILNQVTAEPEVARDDLENSLMRNGVLSALGRKQLLNAVYGKEPDPNDKHDQRTGFTGKNADKDRFFRQHLGNKVLRGWAPGRRVKKGAGIHYENEGNAKAYVYADIEVEDEAKAAPMLGQVLGPRPRPAPKTHTPGLSAPWLRGAPC